MPEWEKDNDEEIKIMIRKKIIHKIPYEIQFKE